MKNNFQTVLAASFVLFSSSVIKAQNISVPAEKKPVQLETSGDPYLQNAFGNKKTSVPYISHNASVRNTSIYTTQVNINSDGQNIIGDAANEPSIAVNPLNENEIVIGWRQFDNVSSDFRQAGRSYTSDGGQTWTFPGVLEPGIFRSDPVLDYDAEGNFYYNSLTLQGVSTFLCKVFRSADGGATWDDGIDAYGGDKQWMTIDRTAGIGSGNIYAFWTNGYSSCYPGFFTRSTDGGDSYEDCSKISGNPFWGTMAVGTDGELYTVGGGSFNHLVVAKSLNAQVPDSSVSWNSVGVLIDGNIGFSGDVNPGGLLGQANIDVDRSNGPGQGNVYVLASVSRLSLDDPGDVMFARSMDGGITWSSPLRINDDASNSNTQWFGTMSVSPTGRIDVVWLDTRGYTTASDSSALYYSYSNDAGVTWSVNEQLSDYFDPHIGYPNQDKMGDYFDMISDTTGAHLAWANTFNGEEDVYYSHITPEIATAVNENYAPEFSVYPNPSRGKFVITRALLNESNEGKQTRFTILNELGEEIFEASVFKTKNEIDISSQPAGIYFIKITDNSGNTAVKKIVRE